MQTVALAGSPDGGLVVEVLVASVQGLCLVGLFIYALLQLHLAWIRRNLEQGPRNPPPMDRELPRVTVQLPIYNERHVARRVIAHVARLDYPRDRLEIQVLDDSTDDTPEIVASALRRLSDEGFLVSHLRREARTGYKAGALESGLRQASGELVAILDADFCPSPDFLRTTLPHFRDPTVAAVQLRWGFLNETYSLLTRLQAFLLRTHFFVEQPARAARGYFANFNGSGGVWRRTAIADAGGWRADTLTEDVDLSYRAQLRGWRVVYLADPPCDSELPVDMDGFRSQQFRWMKGGAENARLHVPRVLRSSARPIVKTHACAHLLASSVYLLTFGTIVSSVAMAFGSGVFMHEGLARYGSLFFVATLSLVAVFHTAQGPRCSGLKGILWFVPMMLAFLVFTLGICPHNAMAAYRGWRGEATEFVRTPKYGIVGTGGEWSRSRYASRRLTRAAWLEAGMLALVGAALVAGWMRRDFSGFPVQLMAASGLAWVLGLTVLHARRAGRPMTTAACAGPLDGSDARPRPAYPVLD